MMSGGKTVSRLEREGLIEATETEREGNYPQRVYALIERCRLRAMNLTVTRSDVLAACIAVLADRPCPCDRCS
jgi:hypothetical protein